jgi:hypothetical protein
MINDWRDGKDRLTKEEKTKLPIRIEIQKDEYVEK